MAELKFRVSLLKKGGWEVEQVEKWRRATITDAIDSYKLINNIEAKDAAEALHKAKRSLSMVNTVSQRSRNKEKLNG